MGIPLCVSFCFSLAAFNIFSLYLIFDSLINMCLGVSPRVYPVWDSLCFLDLGDYFLSHVREVFHYNLLKYFLRPFLLLFFWDPYNLNVGAFSVVPEVLGCLHFFSFFFLYSAPQQLFPPFCLPAHLFVLLPQLFCC